MLVVLHPMAHELIDQHGRHIRQKPLFNGNSRLWDIDDIEGAVSTHKKSTRLKKLESERVWPYGTWCACHHGHDDSASADTSKLHEPLASDC